MSEVSTFQEDFSVFTITVETGSGTEEVALVFVRKDSNYKAEHKSFADFLDIMERRGLVPFPDGFAEGRAYVAKRLQNLIQNSNIQKVLVVEDHHRYDANGGEQSVRGVHYIAKQGLNLFGFGPKVPSRVMGLPTPQTPVLLLVHKD